MDNTVWIRSKGVDIYGGVSLLECARFSISSLVLHIYPLF